MGFIKDLCHFTLELFRFLRNPQAHQEQVRINIEQNRQARIEALEERYGSLTLEPKLSEEIQRYKQFREALDFIARCLEEDRPLTLLMEMEGAQGHLPTIRSTLMISHRMCSPNFKPFIKRKICASFTKNTDSPRIRIYFL